MITAKNIDDMIIKKIDELSNENKKQLLRYIEGLKAKEAKKTIEMLDRTTGTWKDIVDAEKLKKDIYADRLISTRPRVAF